MCHTGETFISLRVKTFIEISTFEKIFSLVFYIQGISFWVNSKTILENSIFTCEFEYMYESVEFGKITLIMFHTREIFSGHQNIY